MASVIRLRPHREQDYIRLHAAVWPEVLATIAACNIRDYSIFLRRPELLLFATWVYVGADFAADMARMKADPATQRWWALTDPCQEKLASAGADEWWAPMDEVFHTGEH